MAGLSTRLNQRDRGQVYAVLFVALAAVTIAALVSAFIRIRSLSSEIDASGSDLGTRISDLENQISTLQTENKDLETQSADLTTTLDGLSFSQKVLGSSLEGDYTLTLRQTTCFVLVCSDEDEITIGLTIAACGQDYCLTGDGWVGDNLKNEKAKVSNNGLRVKGQGAYTCEDKPEKDSRFVLDVWPTGGEYDLKTKAWKVTTLGANASVATPEGDCTGGGKSFSGGST